MTTSTPTPKPSKVDIAFRRIGEVITSGGEYTLEALLREVNWELDCEEMLSMATLRRALTRLPEACIEKKGRKLIVHARHFAKPEEVMAAFRSLETWIDDGPVLIERHKETIRKQLLLADRGDLYQTLEWAESGRYFESDYTVYGHMVRARRVA
jgi:hypothetical protein